MSGFVTSSVGKKYLMGLTGLIWAGFLLTHMIGNMLILVGPDAYNSYSYALTTNHLLLFAELGLVAALAGHVILAIALSVRNRASRPQRYAAAGSRAKGSSLNSRTMIIHGTIILVFVILHLATFKYGTSYETVVENVKMRDLHRLVIEVFQQPGYVAWYVVALLFLLAHLSHGFGSMFQSFGLLHPSYQGLIKKLSWTYAIVVVAGFLIQPLYVFFFVSAR